MAYEAAPKRNPDTVQGPSHASHPRPDKQIREDINVIRLVWEDLAA
jgi:hypothetical protein